MPAAKNVQCATEKRPMHQKRTQIQIGDSDTHRVKRHTHTERLILIAVGVNNFVLSSGIIDPENMRPWATEF